MIGVDLAKSVFQLHGVSLAGHLQFRKKVTRVRFRHFMAKHDPAIMVMEACGSASYRAREMVRPGHEVRLIAPQYVRPLHQRTELVNALRSGLCEYGHVFPKGIAQLRRIEAIIADPASDLPDLARDECHDLLEQIAEQTARIEARTKRARDHAGGNDTARRLQTMPGVGPQTAVAISGFAPPMDSFKRARDFAAWLGLVPCQGFVALFGLRPDLSLSQIFSAHADGLGRPK